MDTNAALIAVDVQTAFDDPRRPKRNNPDAEANIARLVAAWTAADRPIVRVRHINPEPGTAFDGTDPFKAAVAGITPALEITKNVHSSFYGTPDLHAWLSAQDIRQLVIAGIQTNRCCETTARMAGDLGYDVLFAIDATYTFDVGDLTADQLARATAANLDGAFARVVRTSDIV